MEVWFYMTEVQGGTSTVLARVMDMPAVPQAGEIVLLTPAGQTQSRAYTVRFVAWMLTVAAAQPEGQTTPPASNVMQIGVWVAPQEGST
jgi:hypothetical protein